MLISPSCAPSAGAIGASLVVNRRFLRVDSPKPVLRCRRGPSGRAIDRRGRTGLVVVRRLGGTVMKRTRQVLSVRLSAIAFALIASQGAFADNDESGGCVGLPSQAQLKKALVDAVNVERSGLDFQMWATVVDRDGVVCAVAFSGADRGSQWPGSRVISAQKANTANAFSLDGLALSTANLYSAVQPGGSLYGLQHSNPVDTGVAYMGPSASYGRTSDPMVGKKIGGVNVFGGGLALYNSARRVVGAVGVSGDTSCADHNIGWRVRNNLILDYVPAGVSGDSRRPDNIVFDISPNPSGGTGISAGGFGHPTCINTSDPKALPPVR